MAAREKSQPNGKLEEAMALLINNQAAFVAQLADANSRKAETDREIAETRREIADLRRESDSLQRDNTERFARIEAILIEHSRILAEHSRILLALPDAVRDKIGFKIPEKPPAKE